MTLAHATTHAVIARALRDAEGGTSDEYGFDRATAILAALRDAGWSIVPTVDAEAVLCCAYCGGHDCSNTCDEAREAQHGEGWHDDYDPDCALCHDRYENENGRKMPADYGRN